MIGTTISHYEITEKLGEGGMGVVYKAEDTNLKRPVALKFLAAHLLGDEDVKARFRREAEAAAALNHPNICHVYEIGEVDGKTFIAMAFLEGEALDKKIEAGPLTLKDALAIGTQTAQGLQAAHEKGIVHRDIKPANLMVAGAGSRQLVTIMDFGLAQLADRSKLTRLDETMGTVTYMSPEQTYGSEIDRRSDIWSLGVVLYEMVTGQQPFKGHYDQAVMYSITSEEPEPMTAVRTGVPMELELLVNKCLAKDADRRYQSTADTVVDLETLGEKLKSGKSTILRATQPAGAPVGTGSPAGPSPRSGDAGASVASQPSQTVASGQAQAELPVPPAETAARASAQARLAWLVATLCFVALLAVSFLYFRQAPPEAPLRRFTFTPPVAVSAQNSSVEVSPDGQHIAFASTGSDGKLWVQDLDQRQPRTIAGTEGARKPFWSPDTKFIGFAVGGELKKVSAEGGLSSVLCQTPGSGFQGGTWSPDGNLIAFASGGAASRIYGVSSRGGSPSPLISTDPSDPDEQSAIFPHFLPAEAGSRVLLFSAGTRTDQTLMVEDLDTGRREVLGPGAFPFYSRSGHIVYQANRAIHDLWALPFSLDTLQATDEAFPISGNSRGPTVAADQTLVYLDGYGQGEQQLVWRGRRGERIGEIGQPQAAISEPALSPDAQLVAVSGTEGSPDIWIHDISRSLKTRLNFAPEDESRPVWSPDGKQIAYSHRHSSQSDVLVKPADGSGEAQPLVSTEAYEDLCDWSADGARILYQVNDPKNGRDLWYLERKPDGSGYESHPFLQTPFNEDGARFSPDGRFVAYCSNESGEVGVYVRPFPQGGARWQVSSGAGQQPRWRRDGKEIFYVEGDTMIAVSVSTGPGFSVGKAARLFQNPNLPSRGVGFALRYDVSRWAAGLCCVSR